MLNPLLYRTVPTIWRIKFFLGISTLLLSMSVYTKDISPQELNLENALDEAVPEKTDILPTLPPLPPISEEDAPLSAKINVYVKRFEFEFHNKNIAQRAIPESELKALVKPYEGKVISAEELQSIKNIISRYYIDEGFINSGAVIPDQRVSDGIITLAIIEGQLVKVRVRGTDKVQPEYIENRITLDEDEALNIQALQERLQLLHQNPLFKRINAELGPGVQLGEGVLNISVAEEKPYEFHMRFNNHRSPSVGSYRGELEGLHRSITGRGDLLYARYGLTKGLDDYTFSYHLPLNRYDTTLSFDIDKSDSEIVAQPFNQLNVESEADTYAISLIHPVYRSPNTELKLGVRLEKRSSHTYLLGRPFSFSPGVVNGESDISVVRFSQDWLERSRNQVIAARSSFNFGIDAFNATIHDTGLPDSRFFTWLGQFQWVRRLNVWDLDTQLLFRTDMQFANEALLPLEKFSIGGASTVRGYRENYITRDNGLVASLEWRIPLPKKLRIPQLSKTVDDGTIYITPFFDYGRAWSQEGDTPRPKDISSVGLGLRWLPTRYMDLEVYWGKALRDVPDLEDSDLQDDGIHFEINFHL